VSLRIQASHTTVKAWQGRLQDAYRRDAVRLVRRIRGVLARLTPQAPVPVLCERWGRSPAWLYAWQQACILRDLESLVSRPGGGRPEQLTATQQPRLVEVSEAGPLGGGGETACGHGGLIRVRIWREWGGRDHRPDVCTRRHTLGFALHKARWVSAHLDPATRLAWRPGAMADHAPGRHALSWSAPV
jgi:transposase